MDRKLIALLVRWMVHVMYMLVARAEIFPSAEREELAKITGLFEQEAKLQFGDQS